MQASFVKSFGTKYTENTSKKNFLITPYLLICILLKTTLLVYVGRTPVPKCRRNKKNSFYDISYQYSLVQENGYRT